MKETCPRALEREWPWSLVGPMAVLGARVDTVQLSHPYMTTGKTIALTRRTFVAWKAAVHGFAEGQTRLSDFTFTFHFHAQAWKPGSQHAGEE